MQVVPLSKDLNLEKYDDIDVFVISSKRGTGTRTAMNGTEIATLVNEFTAKTSAPTPSNEFTPEFVCYKISDDCYVRITAKDVFELHEDDDTYESLVDLSLNEVRAIIRLYIQRFGPNFNGTPDAVGS